MATLLLIVIFIDFIGLGIPDSLFGAAWPAINYDFGLPISAANAVTVNDGMLDNFKSYECKADRKIFDVKNCSGEHSAYRCRSVRLFNLKEHIYDVLLHPVSRIRCRSDRCSTQ